MNEITWGELTKDIQEKILDEQERQGNKRSRVFFFLDRVGLSKKNGGFDWEDSIDGVEFWKKVIGERDFSVFYTKYPKQDLESTRVMLVSNDEINWYKRVVFEQKLYHNFAWASGETIEQANKRKYVGVYKYAKEIEEEKIILTKEEIAKRLNIDINSFYIAL